MARVKVLWCDDLEVPELGMVTGYEKLTAEERKEFHEWIWANNCGFSLDMLMVNDPEVRTAFMLKWT